MSDRRMFAKTIIDSDAFLDMPISSQALYFHLSMRADDEGFVNNAKKIIRMLGCDDSDMDVLVEKKFVIPFASGIYAIKHWKINNYIRGDRLVPTKYKEERELLSIDENGSYTKNEVHMLPDNEPVSVSDKRKKAYEESSLPYSFTYKMRRAFKGKRCPVCGCLMSGLKERTPSVQHNIPISLGGEHELENISIVCLSCNLEIHCNPTEELNNKDVVMVWDNIRYCESHKIDWFEDPEILWQGDMTVECQADDCQVTDKIQEDDGQMSAQDSIGKVRLDKVSIDNTISSTSLSNKDLSNSYKTVKASETPTLADVEAYSDEIDSDIDPKAFYNEWSRRGWVDAKGKPLSNWKAMFKYQNDKKALPCRKKSTTKVDMDAVRDLLRGE